MNKKSFVTAVISLLGISASHAFMCPTNFNQIQIGDTIAQVEQQCGKADKTDKTEMEDNSPQEWTYYFQQQQTMTSLMVSNASVGSLKATFAFDGQGKLINITVNNVGVSSTNNCGGYVTLGDTRKTVEAACGKPSFVNKQTPSRPQNMEKDEANMQTEMTYMSNPPVTLIFKDGKLAEKR